MARVLICGFEFGGNQNQADAPEPDGYSLNATNQQSATVRSGFYANTVGSLARSWKNLSRGQGDWPYTVFFALYFSAAPASTVVMELGSSGAVQLRFNVDTSLVPSIAGEATGSSSGSALELGVWHTFELRVSPTTTTAATVTWLVNGKNVARNVATTCTTAQGSLLDLVLTGPSSGTLPLIDDLVVDALGSAGSPVEIGDAKVVLLQPISDAQVGSWTGGVGGTTNLFDAVNNYKPIGTAAETNLTQIESADSSGDNSTDEYRPNLTTYANAGIPANAPIKAIVGWVNHGEDVSTGTKTGSVRVLSNPADSGAVNFTAGNDVGALGTWPTNWRWIQTNFVQNPIVDRGVSPQMALRKIDTGTRVLSVDCMGVYAEYTPTFTPWTPAATPQNTLLRM